MYEMCLDLFSIEKIFTEQHFFLLHKIKCILILIFINFNFCSMSGKQIQKVYNFINLLGSCDKNVSVLRYDVLASSIKAKKVSFDLMNHKSTNYDSYESEDNKSQNENEIIFTLTFVERHKKDKKEQNEITQKVSFESFQNEMSQD